MTHHPQVLQPLRRWETLVRGRFEIEHDGSAFTVDAHYLDLDEHIRLYRDGHLIDVAQRRAQFAVGENSQIEAAVAQMGMKYVRLRHGDDRETEPIPPAPGTAEAWRSRLDERHPAASRAVGAAALAIVIGVLVIELPQLINLLGNLAPLAGIATFQVPALTLPGWLNALVIVLGGSAALERSLSMKYNPVLDD